MPNFWHLYAALPTKVQALADKNFTLLKANPQHPSLHFKKVGSFWLARVNKNYRVVATEIPEGLLWFWIGSHDEYQLLIRQGGN